MMKKFVLFLILVLLWTLLFSQEVIENPAMTVEPRILELKEDFRITDTSGEFYFKGPLHMEIDKDRNLFIGSEAQLLKFAPEGTFMKNLVTKGKGPGEIDGAIISHICNDRIYIYSSRMRKIVCLDKKGRFIDEFRVWRYHQFFGLVNGRFILLENKLPPREETGGYFNRGHRIYQVEPGGDVVKTSPDFSTPFYMGPEYAAGWVEFHSAYDRQNQILYINHTWEYLIKTLDLRKNKIIRQFKRDYQRVKIDVKKLPPSRRKRPRPKYRNDIGGLFYGQGRLWVLTSAFTRKGRLFDVFDGRGRYVDCFYLGLYAELLAVSGNQIFVSEPDFDTGLISIVKYRILN
jgi:hypothetical protein